MNKKQIKDICDLRDCRIVCYDKKQILKVFDRLEKLSRLENLGFCTRYNDNNSTDIYCRCMTFENLTRFEITYKENNSHNIWYDEFLKINRKLIKNNNNQKKELN